MELVERREEVRWLWGKFLVSQRRICELMGVAESSQRYSSRRNDEALRERLVEAAREKPQWGYWRLQLKLKAKGMYVNHKRYIEGIGKLQGFCIKHVCPDIRPPKAASDGYIKVIAPGRIMWAAKSKWQEYAGKCEKIFRSARARLSVVCILLKLNRL